VHYFPRSYRAFLLNSPLAIEIKAVIIVQPALGPAKQNENNYVNPVLMKSKLYQDPIYSGSWLY